jgi:hypothetical protein
LAYCLPRQIDSDFEGDKKMKSLLRRNLVLLMLGVTAAAFTVNVNAPAFAKNGGDDNSGSSSSGSGHSGGGGHDNSGSGSGGDDNSGSGGNDNDGDNSGRGSGGNSSDDNDSNDDSNNRSASNDDRENGGGRNKADRPRIEISVDAATRAGLLNGSLAAVDDRGRALEVEADVRNGQAVLTAKPHGGDAKRNPGPIASFDIVPAAQAPVHQ